MTPIIITAEQFEAAVGRPPEHDDLERSNCDKAGQIGHFGCGWDHHRNLPEFIAMAIRLQERQQILAWEKKNLAPEHALVHQYFEGTGTYTRQEEKEQAVAQFFGPDFFRVMP